LEKRAGEPGDVSAQAKAHLQLARLFINFQNPNLNYHRALKELETFRSLTPDDAKTTEIQNWLLALQTLEQSENEKEGSYKTVSLLRGEIAEVRGSLEQQRHENQTLQEKIGMITNKNVELKRALEQQTKKSQKLQESVEKLQEGNERLKATIERLKNLDRQMEEKRKQIK